MVKNDTTIQDFLDDIDGEKPQNFVPSEKSIIEDKNHGFRLDHQGVSRTQPAHMKDMLTLMLR